MTQEEATHAVAYLNAGFPRDTLEPESFAIWVREVMELPHPTAALDAAKRCARDGDRFPTLKEFRQAYRQAFDRHMAGRELEAADDGVPMPPETAEAMRQWVQQPIGGPLTFNPMPYGWGPDGRFHTRHTAVPDIPVTDKVVARPVWERHERREHLYELLPPSAAEIHDAIAVLREHEPSDGTYVGTALHMEATRILDEAGLA